MQVALPYMTKNDTYYGTRRKTVIMEIAGNQTNVVIKFLFIQAH